MEQIQDIKEAVELYNKGLSNLIGNSSEWNEFLKFNSKFYKYKFHENLLLYAQDKNITACATFDEWKKVGRYVKPKPYSKTLKTIYQQKAIEKLKPQMTALQHYKFRFSMIACTRIDLP